MTWWSKLDQILNVRRLRYAFIAGGVLWVAWLISSLLGSGNMDLAGQVVGTDYLQFYASGLTLRQGQSASLYDFAYQSSLEQAIAGPGLKSFHAFITPPFLAWLFVPLTFLPYIWSFIIWSLLGILFLWISIQLISINQPSKGFLFSLTWFPVFAAISFGQNSLLSLFLFSLTYFCWKKGKLFLAGFIFSLLLFKPQMVLGLTIFWLLEWRSSWKALLGLSLGGLILAGLSFLLLPEASLSYVRLARDFLPGMIYNDQFPLWHLHSLRGFWILLFPGWRWLAEGLSLLFSLAGITTYYLFWRKNRQHHDLMFAMAIGLTIWITPHAMIYDWSILLVSALLLWKISPGVKHLWRPIFAMMWLLTFLSGPLTYAQLKVLPVAVQVSVLGLFIVFYTILRNVTPGDNTQGEIQTLLV